MNFMSSVVKYILYLFNIIFVVCGILLIILGSIIISGLGDVKSFNQAIHTETIPIIIIILGCVIFIVSFFGCCGAIRENSICTIIYAILMLILFCLTLALVVWIFVKRDDFLSAMSHIVNQAWLENSQSDQYPMNAIELTFKCCGKTSYMDYVDAGLQLPPSCCGYTSASQTCLDTTAVLMPGCEAKFVDFWSSNMKIIRYGGIGVACVELIALLIACCLCSSFRRSQGHDF